MPIFELLNYKLKNNVMKLNIKNRENFFRLPEGLRVQRKDCASNQKIKFRLPEING